jgi:hypothetical protein
VLTTDGALVIALPAADDVIELRAQVQGAGVERDRVDALIAAHPAFTVVERTAVRETMALDREVLLQLLRGTYRGARLREAERVANVERMSATLASDIVVMRKRAD